MVTVAGRTTTSSGIVGAAGCAQSCGTHTFPHSAVSPLTVQAVSVVLGSDDDGGADGDPPVPAQPAVASAATAISAAQNPRRRRFHGPDAARANRLLAMVTTSSRKA